MKPKIEVLANACIRHWLRNGTDASPSTIELTFLMSEIEINDCNAKDKRKREPQGPIDQVNGEAQTN